MRYDRDDYQIHGLEESQRSICEGLNKPWPKVRKAADSHVVKFVLVCVGTILVCTIAGILRVM